MKIYLDNAATTALDKRVLDQMLPYLANEYGNPSSIHYAGRTARLAIEESRKKVASLLDCQPAEVFFTSCGTESTNTVFQSAVRILGCKHIITSPIEHHATLHTAEVLCREFNISLQFVHHDEDGKVDLESLNKLLTTTKGEKSFVSIMHANNEIGIINDIEQIGALCNEYDALYHCDMVQTIGHLPIALNSLPVDFASGSAHKFHGPKGSGMLYIKGHNKIDPLLLGGGQERNMRAGTENVVGIVGFAAALEYAIDERETENKLTQKLKDYTWEKLKEAVPNIELNGTYNKALSRVLNVSLPVTEKTEMLQMALDIKGIAVSGGSACSSGAMGGSHVINYITQDACVPLRISFCKWNTESEIDFLIKSIKELIAS